MPVQVTRGRFLAAGAAAAAAAVAPGIAHADAPDADLAHVRLLIGAELLAIDFYGGALPKLDGRSRDDARQALADERVHYAALAQLLAAAGGTAATADDVDFSYPRLPLPALALRVERLLLGAYLGAAVTVQTAALRQAIVQIAANEAQHVGVWARLEGRGPIGPAFGPALTIERASGELSAFES